ncbi:MAG: ABC-2 family transporter protein [Candidatus Woesebacteria bacterium]|jgi:ABC-2 type transport system permease protein
MLKELKKHCKVWRILASNELQLTFINRWSNLLFLIGKIFRFGMMLLFLLIIKKQTREFATYTTDQLIVFFLTFNLVDLIAQIFLRGVYVFREKVLYGKFDLYLSQPVNPLLRSLFAKPDINDVIFLIPISIISLLILSQLDVKISLVSTLGYFLLLINSFLIVLAFHILVLCLGVVTTEVDNAIMVYRDLTLFGRLPVDIYLKPIRDLLFSLIPIGIMITVPAQVLMNLNTSRSLIASTLIGIGFFSFSLLAWKWSLKKYSSVGS